MSDSATFLMTLGGLLLMGLATDALGRVTRLPRVTLLMLLGLAVGPEALNLLPLNGEVWFSISASLALVMVGFLLGERFTYDALRESGRQVMWISLAAVVLTAVIVTTALIVAGAPLPLALLLGALATSTAPAATVDVVAEEGGNTRFSRILLGVVAVDDAWGLIWFALTMAMVAAMTDGASMAAALGVGLREILGAVGLGMALGIPGAYLTGRLTEGEPTLLEALGIVFLGGGLALWLEVSPLLTAMVLGATVANYASHHTRPFHAIEGIERPFLILFFVFAGASLETEALETIGVVGGVYLVARAVGRWAGGWVGGTLAGSSAGTRHWIGLALMPQAGVAVGLALIAAERFPVYGTQLLAVAIGATVVFELIGPIFTRSALLHTEDEGGATRDGSR